MEKSQQRDILDLMAGECSLGESYNRLLCSCASADIRTKLIYTQRGVNEAVSKVIDEAANRGWIDDIKADKNTIEQFKAKLCKNSQ